MFFFFFQYSPETAVTPKVVDPTSWRAAFYAATNVANSCLAELVAVSQALPNHILNMRCGTLCALHITRPCRHSPEETRSYRHHCHRRRESPIARAALEPTTSSQRAPTLSRWTPSASQNEILQNRSRSDARRKKSSTQCSRDPFQQCNAELIES